MRSTLNLNEELIAKARELSGISGRTALIHEALQALIARESARRLIALRGTEPQLKPMPRRRPRITLDLDPRILKEAKE